jgi:hypothetical protein
MTWKRRGKGRPPIDDRDAVLGYVASRVNAGASVSEAARFGLTVVGWERRKDGAWASTIRRLAPKTLERRYRTLLAEIMSPLVANLPEETRYIGIQKPSLPPSLSPARELRRGRPKKRTRA